MPALQAGCRGSTPLSSTNCVQHLMSNAFGEQTRLSDVGRSTLNIGRDCQTLDVGRTTLDIDVIGDVAQLDKQSVGLVNRTIRVRLPSSPPIVNRESGK